MYRKFLIAAVVVVSIATPLSAFARSISIGMSGSDVTALQTALIAKGYLEAGKATGYFGPLTDAALKKFQCDQKIICSTDTIQGYGIAGPRTQAALGVASGSSGSVGTTNAQPGDLTGHLTPAATGKFEISGWVPYWRVATATQDVIPHLNQLATVMPFSYTVTTGGIVVDTARLTDPTWVNFVAQAKAQKVRVIPSILWGNGDAMQTILSNSTTRIALEDQIAGLVMANGWDGIDIDFEAKKHESINYFSTFLKGLYQRMGNKWVYCTVEARMPLSDRYLPGQTIPPDATDYANDYVEMNKYCDRVEIMAYDQSTIDQRLNNARSAPYAPVADPGWVEDLVTLAAQTISRNKLIVGIPTYGYEYAVTPLGNNTFEYDTLWPFNPRYATDIASKLNMTPFRNSAGEMGLIYNPNSLNTSAPTGTDSTQTQQATPDTTVTQNLGSQVSTSQPFNYMSWPDAQSIKDKVDLAKRLGVRGVAVFKFDGGEDPGMWSVLK